MARIEGLLEIEPPQTERRIAWAGPPLANFLFTGIAMIFYANRYYLGPLNEEMVLFFIRANLVLAFFNLIPPALPLDGGKILRSSLVHRFNYRKATEIAARLGKILAVFIFAGGWRPGFTGVSISSSCWWPSLFSWPHRRSRIWPYMFFCVLWGTRRERCGGGRTQGRADHRQ